MISKLSKIFASAAIFGALVFSSSVSFADGMEYYNKKHHHHKKHCHTPVQHQPCHTPAPCVEPCAQPKVGLNSGMILGISGDWGFAINENSDFALNGIAPTVTNPTPATPATATAVTAPGFTATAFNAKHDYAYGGNISWGYMMSKGLEANVEVGYHQTKTKSTTISGSSMKSDIVSGLINGVYYADFGSMVLPYVSLGVGVARTKTNGILVDRQSALIGSTLLADTSALDTSNTVRDVISFNDLKATRLAYQAGVGISAMLDSALVGIGYKFFGVNDLDSSDHDFTDMTAVKSGNIATAAAGVVTAADLSTGSNIALKGAELPLAFGTLSNQIHNVTVFAKFIV